MVNRPRTARRGMQPALALRPWRAPSISAPDCREGRSPAARLTCARQSARDRAARTWPAGPEATKDPVPRSVSNRRHGAPAPPSPSMRAARRSRAVWLCFRAPPVDRQHPAGRLRATPRRPRHRLVDARIGPVRPTSAHRPASEPPSTRPHTPNRRLGALLWSAQPGSRPVRAALRPPVGRRSALGQVRFGPQPGPGRSMSPPLRPPAAAQAARQPPTPTRQGPPAPPPRPPAQFPAGAGTRAHTYARACGVEIFRKKNPRE